jgi:hypothetical protein
MAMLTADEMQFDAVVAFDDYWGSEKMAGMKDLDSAEFLGHNPTPTKGSGQIMNMEEFGDVDFHTYNSPPHEAGEASIVLNTVQHRTSTEIQEIQLCNPAQQDRTHHDSLGMLTPPQSTTAPQ